MPLTINDYVLLILLIVSVVFDLTTKKIPNIITFPVMIWGLVSYTIFNGLEGLLFSLSGLGLGIAFLIIPFAIGGIGGGDVKLLGAVGALKGAEFVLIATLYTAICGAIMAFGYLIIKGKLLNTLKKALKMLARMVIPVIAARLKNPAFNQYAAKMTSFSEEEKKDQPLSFAYGLAIAAGTVIAMTDYGRQFLSVL